MDYTVTITSPDGVVSEGHFSGTTLKDIVEEMLAGGFLEDAKSVTFTSPDHVLLPSSIRGSSLHAT